jgi:hypothetical protein
MLYDQILCFYSRLAYGAYLKIQISNSPLKIQIQKYSAKFHLSRNEKFSIFKISSPPSPYPTSFQFSISIKFPQFSQVLHLHQLQEEEAMTSANNKKQMIAANEKKQIATLPPPPPDEKKDVEKVPLLPAVVQCPSPRQMPTARSPITHPATAHNTVEDEEMTMLEDVLLIENKLTLEDKNSLEDKEIMTREKTMDG